LSGKGRWPRLPSLASPALRPPQSPPTKLRVRVLQKSRDRPPRAGPAGLVGRKPQARPLSVELVDQAAQPGPTLAARRDPGRQGLGRGPRGRHRLLAHALEHRLAELDLHAAQPTRREPSSATSAATCTGGSGGWRLIDAELGEEFSLPPHAFLVCRVRGRDPLPLFPSQLFQLGCPRRFLRGLARCAQLVTANRVVSLLTSALAIPAMRSAPARLRAIDTEAGLLRHDAAFRAGSRVFRHEALSGAGTELRCQGRQQREERRLGAGSPARRSFDSTPPLIGMASVRL
jgi:hypothetical protein